MEVLSFIIIRRARATPPRPTALENRIRPEEEEDSMKDKSAETREKETAGTGSWISPSSIQSR